MNEALVAATVDIIEQLLGHDSPQPEVIAALERVLAGRRAGMGLPPPPEMPDSKIEFKECEFGHGRLVASNWTDHGCHWCMIAAEREAGLRQAARIVRELGGTYGPISVADAILAAIPAPVPPQSGEREVEEALRGLIAAFRNPHDGGEFEDGEVPALDRARAALDAMRAREGE